MIFMSFYAKKTLKLVLREKTIANAILVNIVFSMRLLNKMNVKMIKLLENVKHALIPISSAENTQYQGFIVVRIIKKRSLRILIIADVRWMKCVLMESATLKEFLVELSKELLQFFVVLMNLV